MTTPAKFRRALIEQLAFETPFAKRAAMRDQPGLAAKLGITEDLLAEAADLVRSGFLRVKLVGPAIINLEIFMQREFGDAFELLATAHDMSRGQLMRALLHAAMHTPREPNPRAPRRWTKGIAIRGGIGIQGRIVKNHPATRVHLEFEITRGLASALGRRAAAYGVTRTRYMLLWAADLVDGQLGDLVIIPVDTGQLFDDENGYVLPVANTVLESNDNASAS
jgi:hypothetical protein